MWHICTKKFYLAGYVNYREKHETGDHYANRDKPYSGRQKRRVFSHMWNLHLYLHIYVQFMHVMKVEGEIVGKGGGKQERGNVKKVYHIPV